MPGAGVVSTGCNTASASTKARHGSALMRQSAGNCPISTNSQCNAQPSAGCTSPASGRASLPTASRQDAPKCGCEGRMGKTPLR